MPSAIAIKVDVDWHEAGRPHHWELFLVDQDGRPIIVEGADGPQPIEVRGDFEVARPEGVPEGSPVDVAVAVNFSPLPLTHSTRFTWRLTIDGDSEDDWQLAFSTRPPREPIDE